MIYNSDNAVKDIAKAPYLELRARFRGLAQVQDALGAERKALDDEIKRRERAVQIEMKVGSLTLDDKRVLREIIGVGA